MNRVFVTGFFVLVLAILSSDAHQECMDQTDLDVALQPMYTQLEVLKNQLNAFKAFAKRQRNDDCGVLSSCRAYVEAGRSHGNGVYKIKPRCSDPSDQAINVYCEQESNGGGWMRFYYKSGAQTCSKYELTWTGAMISSLGLTNIKGFAVSDDANTVNTERAWILNNSSWAFQSFKVCHSSPCNSNSPIGIPNADVIANLANCKTPSGVDWSQGYAGGYAFVEGVLVKPTNANWERLFNGCSRYKNAGDRMTVRFGGGPSHTGEFVHTSCNDYSIEASNRITSRWNTDNTRVIWIKI